MWCFAAAGHPTPAVGQNLPWWRATGATVLAVARQAAAAWRVEARSASACLPSAAAAAAGVVEGAAQLPLVLTPPLRGPRSAESPLCTLLAALLRRSRGDPARRRAGRGGAPPGLLQQPPPPVGAPPPPPVPQHWPPSAVSAAGLLRPRQAPAPEILAVPMQCSRQRAQLPLAPPSACSEKQASETAQGVHRQRMRVTAFAPPVGGAEHRHLPAGSASRTLQPPGLHQRLRAVRWLQRLRQRRWRLPERRPPPEPAGAGWTATGGRRVARLRCRLRPYAP
mmetsp:Transcript_4288/g.12366  ORF Transcript_4288/g.12366 Transcript_4288/m.12366 type:complete len:280 (+) Transcript_4288:2762-3601(+)